MHVDFYITVIEIALPPPPLVKQSPSKAPEEGCPLLPPTSHDAPARINKLNVLLLLLAAMFYDAAVSGAVDMMAVFVVKEPLSWTAAQVSP